MAWLKKTKGVPGSAPGGLEWKSPDDVVEVDDELAVELLEIPGAGFVSVEAPTEAKAAGDGEDKKESGAAAAKKAAASKPPAAKTAVQE